MILFDAWGSVCLLYLVHIVLLSHLDNYILLIFIDGKSSN